MSAYHTRLAEHQKAANEQRVKSILVFAQTLSKRGAKKTKEWVQARARVSELVRARAELDAKYGRKKGSVVK